MTTQAKVAALAVVVKDGQVLLARRRKAPDAGLWGFPGGHVELGETALDAAARELWEETGVRAAPVRYLTNVDVIERGADGQIRFHFLLAAVLCDFVSGTPVASDDVSDAGWFDVADVLAGGIACSRNVGKITRLACSDT